MQRALLQCQCGSVFVRRPRSHGQVPVGSVQPCPARRGAALGGSLFLEDPIGRITLCQPISQSQPPTLPFSLPPPVGGSLWRDLTRSPVGIFSWKALHALNSRGHLLLEGSQICRIPVGIFSWKALHALNSLWVSSPGRLSDI